MNTPALLQRMYVWSLDARTGEGVERVVRRTVATIEEGVGGLAESCQQCELSGPIQTSRSQQQLLQQHNQPTLTLQHTTPHSLT